VASFAKVVDGRKQPIRGLCVSQAMADKMNFAPVVVPELKQKVAVTSHWDKKFSGTFLRLKPHLNILKASN
jgi:hypothetical protein